MKTKLLFIILLFYGCGLDCENYKITGIESVFFATIDASTFYEDNYTQFIPKKFLTKADDSIFVCLKFKTEDVNCKFFIGHPDGIYYLIDTIFSIDIKLNNVNVNDNLLSNDSSYLSYHSYISMGAERSIGLCSFKSMYDLIQYTKTGKCDELSNRGVVFLVKDISNYIKNDKLKYSVTCKLSNGKTFQKEIEIKVVPR